MSSSTTANSTTHASRASWKSRSSESDERTLAQTGTCTTPACWKRTECQTTRLARRTSIKRQVWRYPPCAGGQRSKCACCSRGSTRLWIRAHKDDDGDVPAAQPVLKLQRGWASPVGGWLAIPIENGSYATDVLLDARHT